MSDSNNTSANKSSATVVIKVGGSFFTELANNKSSEAAALLRTIAVLQSQKRSVVLIHGGGEQVLDRLASLNITSVRKNGLRVTPDADMPIVAGVLAGELNKQLVATCAQYGINAVGISLADGNIAECFEHAADIGAVGVPSAKSPDLLQALLAVNMVPIVASVGKDNKGRLYNVNADHAAICIAELLQTSLYFFADVPGVLDQNKEMITQLSVPDSQRLISNGVITDGMVVKVQSAQTAANAIGKPVIIASWNNAREVLVDGKMKGTQVLPLEDRS